MDERLRRFLPWIPAAALAAAALVFAWRRAWVAEDAYITFRTVDNVLAGLGPRWNPAERVQAYTHPLWMWLLAAAGWIRPNHYLNAITLGLVCSAAAAGVVVFRLGRTPAQAALAVLLLAGSGGYVDYSTSGLENSLAHLLLACFWLRALRGGGPAEVALLFSAVCLNRLDHAVLCAPVMAWVAWRGPLPRVACGLIPLAAWELFSVFYYGSPVPNTAYAKLTAGIPAYDYFLQGLRYLVACAQGDPASVWPPAALLLGVWLLRPGPVHLIAAGAALYTVYIIRIGGDFMLSRFLTGVVLGAAVTAAAAPLPRIPAAAWALVYGGVAAVAAFSPTPTYSVADETYPAPVGWFGEVSDERRYYFAATGLRNYFAGPEFPRHRFRETGRLALNAGQPIAWMTNVGIAGWDAGPRLHIMDGYGLGDALLSRIPMAPQPWRPGHFFRPPPEGYYHSIETGENRFRDKDLGEFWLRIRQVTRGPIFDPERLRAVWRLNTGQYTGLLAHHVDPGQKRRIEELSGPPLTLEALRGVRVELGGSRAAREIEIEVDADDHYFLRYQKQGRTLSARDIADPAGQPPGLRTFRIRVPAYVRWMGFDGLEIRPRGGDGKYALGAIRLID